ncbi:MAG: DUF3576 domain-containing protein [Alphaproteobacteria bacterium]|nr:DUF3576 domain-containing protein [Alphaproteobacteria bacterium]
MMKKFVLLFVVCVNVGCAQLNPYNWWKSSDKEPKQEEQLGPNRFLWEAATDKLSFMNGIVANKESGTIITEWTKIESVEYKVEVRVLSNRLSSDCLKVEVWERLRKEKNEKVVKNTTLTKKTEMIIFNKARELYRKSLNLE